MVVVFLLVFVFFVLHLFLFLAYFDSTNTRLSHAASSLKSAARHPRTTRVNTSTTTTSVQQKTTTTATGMREKEAASCKKKKKRKKTGNIGTERRMAVCHRGEEKKPVLHHLPQKGEWAVTAWGGHQKPARCPPLCASLFPLPESPETHRRRG